MLLCGLKTASAGPCMVMFLGSFPIVSLVMLLGSFRVASLSSMCSSRDEHAQHGCGFGLHCMPLLPGTLQLAILTTNSYLPKAVTSEGLGCTVAPHVCIMVFRNGFASYEARTCM